MAFHPVSPVFNGAVFDAMFVEPVGCESKPSRHIQTLSLNTARRTAAASSSMPAAVRFVVAALSALRRRSFAAFIVRPALQ